MYRRIAGSALLALVLSACGGDSQDKGPAEATGILQVGGAAGVRYSTPTRSGTTDAGGQFKYLPGEAVTFSIGAIELGSVPGASRVSAFTLAGGTPPTTEIALRRELDRSRRTATPFVRAANIHWLLLALDADHDPANGIDVRDAASRLNGATIDLGLRLLVFGGQLQSLAPNMTLNIPPSRVIAHAYQSIGVKVAVHGVTDQRTTTTLVPYVLSSPTNNEFRRYNADGSRQSEGSDFSDDGTPDVEYSWTYDGLGRKKKNSLHVASSIYVLTSSHDGEYQYDARGAVTGYIDQFDRLSDGTIDSTSKSVFENDVYGFPLLQTTDQVQGQDGALMSRDITHSEYDSQHRQTGSVTETDSDGDGVIDTRVRYSSSAVPGRSTTYVTDTDDNADGVIDSRMTETTVFGQGTGTNIITDETDDELDGVIDSRVVTTAHYDRDGLLRWQESESDIENDGVIDWRWRVELDYDLERRAVTERQYQDNDGDGVNESVSTRVSAFDSTGNLLSTSSTSDYLSYGTLHAEDTQTRQYGASGELLGGSGSSTSGPIGLPGAGPTQSTMVATNAAVADGVLLLAQEYLDPNYSSYVSSAF